jgi:hypothetical protein
VSQSSHHTDQSFAAHARAREAAERREEARTRAQVPYVRWGIATGALGALVVAGFFLVVDILAGRPLATPTALGATLFQGAAFDLTRPVSAPLVIGYTAVHGAFFIALASLASSLLLTAPHLNVRFPGLSGVLFAAFFVTLTAMFMSFAGLYENEMSIWHELGGVRVALANLLAAGGMAATLAYAFRRQRAASAPAGRDDG